MREHRIGTEAEWQYPALDGDRAAPPHAPTSAVIQVGLVALL